MVTEQQKRFQILALSGGGYRGLYTARILADFEEEIGAPIGTRFDLIAGTSIGGILAIALAMEIPASQLVEFFEKHGDEIFAKQFSLCGVLRASYSSKPLAKLLAHPDLLGERKLGECKHPVLIPAINYSTGAPVMFKTPHHPSFKRDWQYLAVDVALATSAAPSYFARHTFDNCQYVDGGLFANAPGQLALHEAVTFMGQRAEDVHLVSVGTLSSKYTADPSGNRAGGTLDWGGVNPTGMPKRLFGLAISVQESLSRFMLMQTLGNRYEWIDDPITDDQAHAVGLDVTTPAAREVLLGQARQKSKEFIGKPIAKTIFGHECATPNFHYGPHAKKEQA